VKAKIGGWIMFGAGSYLFGKGLYNVIIVFHLERVYCVVFVAIALIAVALILFGWRLAHRKSTTKGRNQADG
jgi:membrane protein implicated in regulation of membrane protease activity